MMDETLNSPELQSKVRSKVDQMRVLAALKQKQLDALKVRAGIEGAYRASKVDPVVALRNE
jgi:hypothetical protein